MRGGIQSARKWSYRDSTRFGEKWGGRRGEESVYLEMWVRGWVSPTTSSLPFKRWARYPLALLHPSAPEWFDSPPCTGHTHVFQCSALLPAHICQPSLISCLPARCTPSAPHIPLGQYPAPRALSSLEDQTVVANQSIQGTTVANCLTHANSQYFSVCLD